MKNKSSVGKIIGLGATVLGMVATLLSEWASEKRMKESIEEEVKKQLETQDETEE